MDIKSVEKDLLSQSTVASKNPKSENVLQKAVRTTGSPFYYQLSHHVFSNASLHLHSLQLLVFFHDSTIFCPIVVVKISCSQFKTSPSSNRGKALTFA